MFLSVGPTDKNVLRVFTRDIYEPARGARETAEIVFNSSVEIYRPSSSIRARLRLDRTYARTCSDMGTHRHAPNDAARTGRVVVEDAAAII